MNYKKSFFYGIIAAAGALFLEFIFIIFFLDSNNYEQIVPLSTNVILASAFIEEALKYIFIVKIYNETEKKIKVVSYSLILGAGFSFFEIILNLTKYRSLAELGNIHLWGAFFLHLATAGLIGFTFAKTKEKTIIFSIIVLLAAFFIHASYNFAILKIF